MGDEKNLSSAINRALYYNKKPTREEYSFALNSKNQVPAPTFGRELHKELEGSQNLFWLTAATKMLYGDFSDEESLIFRLKRELMPSYTFADKSYWVGHWGTEQDSPIYWGYMMMGRVAVASATNNKQLKDLCKRSIAAFLFSCQRSFFGGHVLQAGMRGTGSNELFSYELDYIFKKFVLEQSIKPKDYWYKEDGAHDEGINGYGWILSGSTERIIPQARIEFMYYEELHDVGVRVPKHYLDTEDFSAVWVEREGNGNTPSWMATFYNKLTGEITVLPGNKEYYWREGNSSGKINYLIENGNITFTYTGVYINFPGNGKYSFVGRLSQNHTHTVWNEEGLTSYTLDTAVIDPGGSGGDPQVVEEEKPPQKYEGRSIWRKVEKFVGDVLKSLKRLLGKR